MRSVVIRHVVRSTGTPSTRTTTTTWYHKRRIRFVVKGAKAVVGGRSPILPAATGTMGAQTGRIIGVICNTCDHRFAGRRRGVTGAVDEIEFRHGNPDARRTANRMIRGPRRAIFMTGIMRRPAMAACGHETISKAASFDDPETRRGWINYEQTVGGPARRLCRRSRSRIIINTTDSRTSSRLIIDASVRPTHRGISSYCIIHFVRLNPLSLSPSLFWNFHRYSGPCARVSPENPNRLWNIFFFCFTRF